MVSKLDLGDLEKEYAGRGSEAYHPEMLLWVPILPRTSQQLHELLGHEGRLFGRQYTETIEDKPVSRLVLRYDHSGATGVWQPTTLPPRQALRKPHPLFIKLDEDVPEKELRVQAEAE